MHICFTHLYIKSHTDFSNSVQTRWYYNKNTENRNINFALHVIPETDARNGKRKGKSVIYKCSCNYSENTFVTIFRIVLNYYTFYSNFFNIRIQKLTIWAGVKDKKIKYDTFQKSRIWILVFNGQGSTPFRARNLCLVIESGPSIMEVWMLQF